MHLRIVATIPISYRSVGDARVNWYFVYQRGEFSNKISYWIKVRANQDSWYSREASLSYPYEYKANKFEVPALPLAWARKARDSMRRNHPSEADNFHIVPEDLVIPIP